MEARYLTDLEWRICHAVNIYVFRNGRDGEQPILVHIPPAKKKNMRTVMGVIQERVKYPVGYAKFLYKMDGTRVKDPCELEMYNNYVVASNFDKYFKCAAYGRKRSPLLVLNRESKHVRVLKLQNQNYYEWLLKKKAVGEERPPYIYPAYYTNENLRPQDLPLGNMGNYQPPEVQAPGCCYPRADGGKTYRVEGDQQYVVNSVTVEVNPDLTGLTDPRKMRRPKKYSEGTIKNKHQERRSKKAMKERTPSDMINANVFTSTGTSHETVGTSGTDELLKSTHNTHQSRSKQHRQEQHRPRSHSRRKSKHSHRNPQAHPVVSEEFHEKQPVPVDVNESSGQSLEDLRKHQQHKKASKKSKKRDRDGRERDGLSTDMIPPAPPQFRDPVDARTSLNPIDCNNNQEIFKLVERAFHPGVSLTPSVNPQKPFLYSPEKLAEINSSGNIQPLQLTFANQHSQVPAPVPGQWALIRQPPPPPPQLMQQVYAIDSHTGQNITGVIPTQTSLDSARLAPYPPNQQPPNHHIVQQPQQQQQQHQQPGMPQFHTLIPTQTLSPSPSSQAPGPPYQQHHPQSHQSLAPMQTQCLMIPANMSQQPLQPGNVSSLPQHTTHLVALPNGNSQNQLQQVYQLGIVQQPSPQNCIEVDARAMRQFVDNQKLIEERFKQASYQIRHSNNRVDRGDQIGPSERRARRSDSTLRLTSSDQTESELDIPFTPLKTYRLHPRSSASPPALTERRRQNKYGDEGTTTNSRSRFRMERLPKVKSRNVAIQMGFPTASARTARRFSHFLDSLHKPDQQSEISFILDRNRNLNNSGSNHSGRKYSSSMCMIEPVGSTSSPRLDRDADRDRYPIASTNSRDFWNVRRSTNFGSSYSEQYVNLNSGRLNNSDKFNDSKLLRTARNRLSDPVLEELVTIPPPTEFRETQRFPGRPRPPPHDISNTFNDKPPHSPSNHKYAYTNNDRTTLKYMYDQYP